jgi:hypothetical protein
MPVITLNRASKELNSVERVEQHLNESNGIERVEQHRTASNELNSTEQARNNVFPIVNASSSLHPR